MAQDEKPGSLLIHPCQRQTNEAQFFFLGQDFRRAALRHFFESVFAGGCLVVFTTFPAADGTQPEIGRNPVKPAAYVEFSLARRVILGQAKEGL